MIYVRRSVAAFSLLVAVSGSRETRRMKDFGKVGIHISVWTINKKRSTLTRRRPEEERTCNGRLSDDLDRQYLFTGDKKIGRRHDKFVDYGLDCRFDPACHSIVIERSENRRRQVWHFARADDRTACRAERANVKPFGQS